MPARPVAADSDETDDFFCNPIAAVGLHYDGGSRSFDVAHCLFAFQAAATERVEISARSIARFQVGIEQKMLCTLEFVGALDLISPYRRLVGVPLFEASRGFIGDADTGFGSSAGYSMIPRCGQWVSKIFAWSRWSTPLAMQSRRNGRHTSKASPSRTALPLSALSVHTASHSARSIRTT